MGVNADIKQLRNQRSTAGDELSRVVHQRRHGVLPSANKWMLILYSSRLVQDFYYFLNIFSRPLSVLPGAKRLRWRLRKRSICESCLLIGTSSVLATVVVLP